MVAFYRTIKKEPILHKFYVTKIQYFGERA